nr:hypothetical protein [uncultured Hyphomonas sp.]
MAIEDQSYLTGDQLHAKLAEQGVRVKDSELRSWRRLGLLPPSRESGIARHPISSVAQIFEITRLFEIKKKADFVGWQLWLRGYDVDERYWRPLIESSAKDVQKWSKRITNLVRRADDDEATGDALDGEILELANTGKLPPPLSNTKRNVSAEDQADALRILLDAIAGSFDPDIGLEDKVQRLNGVSLLMGMRKTNQDSVLGQRIQIFDVLPGILKAFGEIQNAPIKGALSSRAGMMHLADARDTFFCGMKAASDFHAATSWIFGTRAFGLKTARWIFERAPASFQAGIIVCWMQVRADSAFDTPSLGETREQAKQAARLLEISQELRHLSQKSGPLAEILTPKRLRSALQNNEQLEKLIQELHASKVKLA